MAEKKIAERFRHALRIVPRYKMPTLQALDFAVWDVFIELLQLLRSDHARPSRDQKCRDLDPPSCSAPAIDIPEDVFNDSARDEAGINRADTRAAGTRSRSNSRPL